MELILSGLCFLGLWIVDCWSMHTAQKRKDAYEKWQKDFFNKK